MSPYDLEKGCLIFRHKDERASVGRASAQPVPSPLSWANASAPVKGDSRQRKRCRTGSSERIPWTMEGKPPEQRETLEKGPSHNAMRRRADAVACLVLQDRRPELVIVQIDFVARRPRPDPLQRRISVSESVGGGILADAWALGLGLASASLISGLPWASSACCGPPRRAGLLGRLERGWRISQLRCGSRRWSRVLPPRMQQSE
jgi:hypothetical protein